MLTGIEANDKGRRPGRVMAVGCLPFVVVAAVACGRWSAYVAT